MGSLQKYTASDLLQPFKVSATPSVSEIYQYLESFDAVRLPWYQQITVLDHIANVALFASTIARQIQSNHNSIDLHRVWLMAWLRDIGRVPWGIASSQNISEITQNYGHHGYLGYKILLDSGVNPDLAIISMTHIGSGITATETAEINAILSKPIFPVQDWYAKTLEEKIIVIADKIPGWHNTITSHYEANQKGDTTNNKIYSWLPDQSSLWSRFWQFKHEVDMSAGCDILSLFDPGLLESDPSSYYQLPSPQSIAQLEF